MNANNTPDGVIGLQLVHSNNEKQHIRVSVLRSQFDAVSLPFIFTLSHGWNSNTGQRLRVGSRSEGTNKQ